MKPKNYILHNYCRRMYASVSSTIHYMRLKFTWMGIVVYRYIWFYYPQLHMSDLLVTYLAVFADEYMVLHTWQFMWPLQVFAGIIKFTFMVVAIWQRDCSHQQTLIFDIVSYSNVRTPSSGGLAPQRSISIYIPKDIIKFMSYSRL